jgi:hypothetical protein
VSWVVLSPSGHLPSRTDTDRLTECQDSVNCQCVVSYSMEKSTVMDSYTKKSFETFEAAFETLWNVVKIEQYFLLRMPDVCLARRYSRLRF